MWNKDEEKIACSWKILPFKSDSELLKSLKIKQRLLLQAIKISFKEKAD